MSARALICVREHSGARGVARLVLFELAGFAHDDGGGAWPAQPTIAARAGVHRATVQRALTALLAAGLVEVQVHGGPRGTNRYRVVLCPSCRTERQEGPRPPHAAQSGRGRRTERQGPAAQSGRNLVNEVRQESPRAAAPADAGGVRFEDVAPERLPADLVDQVLALDPQAEHLPGEGRGSDVLMLSNGGALPNVAQIRRWIADQEGRR